MSLIAGLHLGDFALIAADKREMSISGDILIPDNDLAKKIINTEQGYVTGSGIVELLHPVKESLVNTNITSTDQVIEIINNGRNSFRATHSANSEWAEDQIKKTGWLFTYITEDKGQFDVRIAMVHGSWIEEKIRLLYKGSAMVIAPVDGTDEEAQRLSEILTKELKTTDELPDHSNSIAYHVPLLQSIFKHVSEICDSVSESFHVAVHTSYAQMMISKEISAYTTKLQFEKYQRDYSD